MTKIITNSPRSLLINAGRVPGSSSQGRDACLPVRNVGIVLEETPASSLASYVLKTSSSVMLKF